MTQKESHPHVYFSFNIGFASEKNTEPVKVETIEVRFVFMLHKNPHRSTLSLNCYITF